MRAVYEVDQEVGGEDAWGEYLDLAYGGAVSAEMSLEVEPLPPDLQRQYDALTFRPLTFAAPCRSMNESNV